MCHSTPNCCHEKHVNEKKNLCSEEQIKKCHGPNGDLPCPQRRTHDDSAKGKE